MKSYWQGTMVAGARRKVSDEEGGRNATSWKTGTGMSPLL